MVDSKVIWQPQPGPQTRFLECPAQEVFFGGARGGGKRLADDTPVPVPLRVDSSGWKRHGDLRAGDFVFHPSGKEVCVKFVTDAFLPQRCYAVVFDTDEEIVADGDHLWHTWTKQDRVQLLKSSEEWRAKRRATRPPRMKNAHSKPGTALAVAQKNREHPKTPRVPTGDVRTTEHIAASIQAIPGEINHSIPVCAPIETCSNVPIDPYLLGLWLGDGVSKSGRIGMSLEDWLDIEAYVEKPEWVHLDRPDKRKTPFQERRFGGLTTALHTLGILGNKRIPTCYLRAVASVRLAVLQGICDTDGTCDKRGQVEVGFSSVALAGDLAELVASLGIKATLRKRLPHDQHGHGKEHWRLKFVTPMQVFRLRRKTQRQAQAKCCPQSRQRYIVACRPVSPTPMRCIKTDAPDGLYLVGRGFIATHNTDALIGDWINHSDKYGAHANGLLIRRTFKQLQSLVQPRLMDLLPKIGAVWSPTKTHWTMPNGAVLTLGYLESEQDAENLQGGEISWLGVDEAGNFPTPNPIDRLNGAMRSKHGVPCVIRLTGNPGGPGQGWIHARFILPSKPMVPFRDPASGTWRVFIPSKLKDNPKLTENDPTYMERLKKSGPPWLVRAWLDGDWEASAEGGIIRLEWFKRYQEPPTVFDFVLNSWDTAIKAKQQNDFTAGAHIGVVNKRVYILDVRRKKCEMPQRLYECRRMAFETHPNAVLIEDKASGSDMIQLLREDESKFPFPIVPCDPGGDDKIVRAQAESPMIETGNVYLPEYAPWLHDFEMEFRLFPEGVNDDQVDMLSQALRYVRLRLSRPSVHRVEVNGREFGIEHVDKSRDKWTEEDFLIAEIEARNKEAKKEHVLSEDDVGGLLWSTLPDFVRSE